MKRIILSLAACGALAACGGTAANHKPVITQYNGHTVTLQIDTAAAFLPEAERLKVREANLTTAAEACGTKTVKAVSVTPHYRGTSTIPTHFSALYLCR